MTGNSFFRPEALLADMATVLPTPQDGDTTSYLSSSLDAIALFVHSCMRTAGFRLLGFNENRDSKIGTLPGCIPFHIPIPFLSLPFPPNRPANMTFYHPHRIPAPRRRPKTHPAMERRAQHPLVSLRTHPVLHELCHPRRPARFES